MSDIKWIRSKVFPEVVFSYQIPHRLLIEENGRINLYGGSCLEKSKRLEKGVRILRSFSRLDNAKLSLMKNKNLQYHP